MRPYLTWCQRHSKRQTWFLHCSMLCLSFPRGHCPSTSRQAPAASPHLANGPLSLRLRPVVRAPITSGVRRLKRHVHRDHLLFLAMSGERAPSTAPRCPLPRCPSPRPCRKTVGDLGRTAAHPCVVLMQTTIWPAGSAPPSRTLLLCYAFLGADVSG